MSDQYDVLVVGAGPGGIAAATIAESHGCRTAVIESGSGVGGQIWRGTREQTRNGMARSWIDRFQKSGAKLLCGTTIFSVAGEKRLAAEVNGKAIELGYEKLILATGARELFLPFLGWTLPNVFGAGGLEALAKDGWPVHGKRVVLVGTGPLLLAAAEDLKRHGAQVVAIAEQAPWSRAIGFGFGLWRHPSKLLQGMKIRAALTGTKFQFGVWPVQAEGKEAVESVALTDGRREWSIPCDALACSFGLVANCELAKLIGCKINEGFVAVDEKQQTSVEGVYAVGELTGIGGADAALIDGTIAGMAAVGSVIDSALRAKQRSWREFRNRLRLAFALRKELAAMADAETIVCRCEDVRRRQIEGFGSWREAKLQTRLGMGPCQGRICGAAAQVLFGWTNDSVRSPIMPVAVGSLGCNREETS